MDEDFSRISDPVKIANEYFTTITCEITKSITKPAKSRLAYFSNPNLDSFFLSPCAPNEVSEIIQSLKNGKSSGPNSILVRLLKVLN